MSDKPLDGSHDQAARTYAYREGYRDGRTREQEMIRSALEAMRDMALRSEGEWAAEIARKCEESLGYRPEHRSAVAQTVQAKDAE